MPTFHFVFNFILFYRIVNILLCILFLFKLKTVFTHCSFCALFLCYHLFHFSLFDLTHSWKKIVDAIKWNEMYHMFLGKYLFLAVVFMRVYSSSTFFLCTPRRRCGFVFFVISLSMMRIECNKNKWYNICPIN